MLFQHDFERGRFGTYRYPVISCFAFQGIGLVTCRI